MRAGAFLLALACALPARGGETIDPTGPPFAKDPATPHQAVARVDVAPARGVLALLSGGPQPGATLRALKESPVMARVLAAERLAPEDFYGRLVAAAAGTPDPLLSGWVSSGRQWDTALSSLDGEGNPGFAIEARRVLALLPEEPKVSLKLTLVPFFAVSGFQEVAANSEGDDWVLVADLPRLAGDALGASSSRELTLKTLRAASAIAWRALFTSRWGSGPAWKEPEPGLDALVARTVVEGPPMLFLIPEEFYPLDALFEEPIRRASARWSAAVEALADPKRKESERAEILSRTMAGDFWGRSAAVMGVVITDTLLRKPGREAYLKALGQGPRAVMALWLDVTRDTKLTQPSKAARKALEKLLAAEVRSPAGAGTR